MILKKFANGSYELRDISRKIHETRVNNGRLKPYFQRMTFGGATLVATKGGEAFFPKHLFKPKGLET